MKKLKKIIIGVLVILLLTTHIQAKENKQKYKDYAHDLVINTYHWTEEDYNNLVKLWNKESNWRVKAKNKNGACGIAQAYPCKKMKKYGKDYKTNYKVQINFGLVYIKKKYKNPSKAYKHFKKKHWY